MAREYPTVLDLVGNTPIVRLPRLSQDVPATLLAKLEYMNPGGSNKDRIGQEMISMLRGYGAEVVITPTAVDHDSPESYYSVSSRLAEEIPGGFKPDQYSNMANPEVYYRVTGPEILEQTGGEIDALLI